MIKTTYLDWKQFKDSVEKSIEKEPDGILLFDISLRYGSIESDIVNVARQYGFSPELTEEERTILNENSNDPDNHIEFIYELSQEAEDYLNDMLQQIGIDKYYFGRITEGEIWGLFPFEEEEETDDNEE
jgi:hypothetical protein